MSETPKTDALRALMAEIYEPDNAALDHMLEKYAELERETTRPEVACSGETPRTDALIKKLASMAYSAPCNHAADLCRQLERELAEIKAEYKGFRDQMEEDLPALTTPSPLARKGEG